MKTLAATIDFGTSKIVTLLAESGGFNRCDIIGSGTVPYDGYMNGNWINSRGSLVQAIRNSINAAELEAKTPIKEIYVGVPCEYIHVVHQEAKIPVTAEDGRVTEEDIDLIQDEAADKLGVVKLEGTCIHRSPAWFKVDEGKKLMSPVGIRGTSLSANISFILADPLFLREVGEMLGELGVAVMGYLSPALGEALLLLPLDERDRAAVLVDMGYLNTEVSVIEGDAIIYHAVLPMGGGHIAADLAQDLGITLKNAERLKREFIYMPDEFDPEGDPEVVDEDGNRTTFPRDLVKRIVDGTTGEILEMIDLTIKDAQALISARSQIFLTGGGIAMTRGGREALAKKLGRSVKGAVPKAARHNTPVYASALGLTDLVFDSIEDRLPQDDSLPGRLAGGIRNIFAKK